MLISPVYAYHQVNQKIYSGLQRLGEGLKYLIQLLIVRPLLRTYEVLKYIILFKWVPGTCFRLKYEWLLWITKF